MRPGSHDGHGTVAIRENGDEEERRPLFDDVNDDDAASSSDSLNPPACAAPRDGITIYGMANAIFGKLLGWWQSFYEFAVSEHGKGVFKFGLAYLLGSLATFIPFLSAFLGHQDGKHIVATITVYFHPARSRGSMIKALICALLAFLYTTFVSVTSMCVSMLFENMDLLVVGHVIVLVVFCGGGFALIGWTKQRLNDPLVNVACSLASLSTITVLTKEGAVQKGNLSFAKISQTLKMLIIGVCAAMAVSFLFFPISARKKLRANVTTITTTLAIMLGHMTESFITGSDEDMYDVSYTKASTQNKRSFVLLDKLVKEAKLEHYLAGTEREYRLEKNLVRCVQDINQNIGGLQSAAALQFQLLKQSQQQRCGGSRKTIPGQKLLARENSVTSYPGLWSIFEESGVLSHSGDHEEDRSRSAVAGLNIDQDGSILTPTPSPQRMFDVFIDRLGPSMV